MKKILLLLLICALPFTMVNAQGFLKNLKSKVGNVMGQTLGLSGEEEPEPVTEETQERIKPTDQVRKKVSQTASWDDEMIMPSTASTPDALIKELPALPLVNDFVNPNAEKRATFYRRIAAVNMRVNELDKQYACSDEEMNAFVDNLYLEQARKYGLPIEDLKALDKGELSAEEEERLQQKIAESLVGDLSGLMALSKAAEGKQDKDGNISEEDAVALMAQFGDQLDFGTMMENSQKLAQETRKSQEQQQRLMQMNLKLANIGNNSAATESCNQLAKKHASGLKKIYSDLCSVDDPDKIESLYERADSQMKKYRREAANVWLKDLQKRIDLLKTEYPKVIAMEAEMIREGMLPACMERRSSLNYVSLYANLLDEAYREFPQADLLPVCRETLLELPENERLMIAESGFATSVDGFLEGSIVYAVDDKGMGIVYEYGSRRELRPGEKPDFSRKEKRPTPAYGDWTSASGKRTVNYSRDGALVLHDGSAFYPLAFEKKDNTLIWIIIQDNCIEQCTYKL